MTTQTIDHENVDKIR